METLDEKLERLYGPQKRKFGEDAVCVEMPPQRSYFEEIEYQVANIARRQRPPAQRTGKEMAEILLGHSIDKEWYYNQAI